MIFIASFMYEQPHCWWCQENSHGCKCEGGRDLLGKGEEYNMLYGVLERGVKEYKVQEYRIVSIYRSIYIYLDVSTYLSQCTHKHLNMQFCMWRLWMAKAWSKVHYCNFGFSSVCWWFAPAAEQPILHNFLPTACVYVYVRSWTNWKARTSTLSLRRGRPSLLR